MVFGLYWFIFNLIFMVRFVIMNSAASFYFSSNKTKMGSAQVTKACFIAIFKHGGSIALSGLVMIFLQILSSIARTVAHAVHTSDNVVVKCLICCVRCFIDALERMVEYLNIDALSFMAISGDSFCKSAWLGFLIDIKHLFDFWLARAMGILFLFFGLLTNVLVSVGCFILISNKLYPNAELN